MKDINNILEDGKLSQENWVPNTGEGYTNERQVRSCCRTLKHQELKGADTVAAEICEGPKGEGLAESLFKKLNYQAPSSSCSVRQLCLYVPGLFCEKLN